MLEVKTNGMYLDELAERVLNDLGITVKIPLMLTYLIQLFQSLQDNVQPGYDYVDLQNSYNDLKRRYEQVCDDVNQVVREKQDLKNELGQLKMKTYPINWAELCVKYPNNKIAMIKDIRSLYGFGLKEAKDLCDANVFEQATPDTAYVHFNFKTWKYAPIKADTIQ